MARCLLPRAPLRRHLTGLASRPAGTIGPPPGHTYRPASGPWRGIPIGLRRRHRHDDALGRVNLHIFSSLAQFERRLIQERTKAGLAAARARGRTGGRPPLTPNDAKVALANKLFADKSVDPDDICATLKISKTTLYRYVEIATGRLIRSRNHSR